MKLRRCSNFNASNVAVLPVYIVLYIFGSDNVLGRLKAKTSQNEWTQKNEYIFTVDNGGNESKRGKEKCYRKRNNTQKNYNILRFVFASFLLPFSVFYSWTSRWLFLNQFLIFQCCDTINGHIAFVLLCMEQTEKKMHSCLSANIRAKMTMRNVQAYESLTKDNIICFALQTITNECWM